MDSLYHPPHIEIDTEKTKNSTLYLNHHFEGKPLVREFIANTMMGIEFLWGGPVVLETSEFLSSSIPSVQDALPMGMPLPQVQNREDPAKWERVLYTMKDRKLTRNIVH
ncbi:MAG: hypothetical protein SV775_16000 [Thermodesulfobacteriota bacterium]|nr:hypothetical protein [Thermodesulfobacteriota bacterium]